jgi:hypothetical protein
VVAACVSSSRIRIYAAWYVQFWASSRISSIYECWNELPHAIRIWIPGGLSAAIIIGSVGRAVWYLDIGWLMWLRYIGKYGYQFGYLLIGGMEDGMEREYTMFWDILRAKNNILYIMGLVLLGLLGRIMANDCDW